MPGPFDPSDLSLNNIPYAVQSWDQKNSGGLSYLPPKWVAIILAVAAVAFFLFLTGSILLEQRRTNANKDT